MTRRPCKRCGKNRAEKFFTSPRGRVCSSCRTATRRRTSRASHLERTYGISEAEYSQLLQYQGGACAICNGVRPYSLQVDHDHKTGLVRGLLCKQHNKRLLPAAKDDIAILESAILYLKNPPARAVVGERVVPDVVASRSSTREIKRTR